MKNPMWFFVNEKCLGTKAVKMFNVRFHSQSRTWRILKEQFQSQNITLKSIAVLHKYDVFT